MDAFGLVPNIIATIETVYKVIKFFEEIKSSGLDCNKYISEASSCYILLQQIREHLNSNLAEAHNGQPPSRHLQALAGEDGVLEHYKSDMEEVANILLEVKRHRFRRVFIWHREKAKIEDIFRKTERRKSSIQLALSQDQLSLSGHTHNVLNRVEARIETTATLHATEIAESEREEIIQWIYQSTVNHDNFQRDYSAVAQDGTGQAFLSSDAFRRWAEGTCATIVCPGLPGAGKTIMASIVKSHLDEKAPDSSHLTAVLYFNYKRHLEDHEDDKLLLAVLAQFLSQSQEVPDLLQSKFRRKDSIPVGDITSVLESLIRSSPCSFLIMDALDEFYDDEGARSRFLRLIQRLQTVGNLKIMMTARPHLSDDPAIYSWSDATTVQITASDDDLHTYLDHRICGFPHLPDDFDLRLSIADRIVEASSGIFLLAVLHSDSLKDAYNTFEVEDILDNLSKGPDALDRAYEDAIKRIDHQPANRRYYARLTISWMVQCRQPMTPMELQHAVTKPEHLERGPTASGLVKIDALVSFCAGLVTIDHESNVFRFVHYTTQEYFTRDRLIKWLPGADLDTARLCTTYLMNPRLLQAVKGAHEKWSECMRGRKEWVSGGGSIDDYPLNKKLEMLPQDAPANWPFLEYCKKHWGSHCSKFQEPLEILLLQFLTGPAEIVYCELDLAWKDYEPILVDLWPLIEGEIVYDARLRRVNPVSICARWGLQHLTSKLLDQGFDFSVAPFLEVHPQLFLDRHQDAPRTRGVADDEPLLLAYQFGHMELAALLLARASISDDVYYEVFRTADKNKDLEMLDLIITKCPLDIICLNRIAACSSIDEVRIRNILLQLTPQFSVDQHLDELQALFRRPSASFWVEYILKQGLDVNKTYDGYSDGPTGIELAAQAGCLESVRVLLDCSDVQVCRSDRQDALAIAAEGGYVEIFRELLSYASSNLVMSDSFQCSVERVFYHRPRSSGCGFWEHCRSRVAIMKSLIELDLNRLHFDHLEEAIQSTVRSAGNYEFLDTHEAMMNLILHHSNIDFRRRGIHGRTLLQTAVSRALVGSVSTYGQSKESVFADDKYTRTLSMLLEHPAFDYSGQYNPLTEVSTMRSLEFNLERYNDSSFGIFLNLQMLLDDPRFNPDTPDELGRTALSHASEHHIEDLIKMLLQHPLVNVNSRDESGRTPLSYAAISNWGYERKSVLPILLENDKIREHANCPDSAGITPLMYGCASGRAETVGLLLDVVGTEANLHDNRGRTPLLHALKAEAGNRFHREQELLEVLLANPNIAVNVKDKDGRSTVYYALRYFWRREDHDILRLLQHEHLDISAELLEMRDDDGQVLDSNKVLRIVKKLRENPLKPTESRHLDLIESIFSAGRLPA